MRLPFPRTKTKTKQKNRASLPSLQRTKSFFIDFSTPKKVATRLDFEKRSPHVEQVETSPPREESPFEHEPEFEHELEFEHEPSPKRSPEIDPDQQRVYNYLETLEQVVAGPSTILPVEPLTCT
jgi:hypothetical protein